MATRLQCAQQERGWSQPQLIMRLVKAAAAEGEQLPSAVSLKSMLSRWENGKAHPDPL